MAPVPARKAMQCNVRVFAGILVVSLVLNGLRLQPMQGQAVLLATISEEPAVADEQASPSSKNEYGNRGSSSRNLFVNSDIQVGEQHSINDNSEVAAGRDESANTFILSSFLSSKNVSSSEAISQYHQSYTSSRQLPIRNENGLILVYIHIPKTGGTTLRKPFERMGKVFFVWGRNQYEKQSQKMTEKLTNWKTGDFALFELHGGSAAPYMEFRRLLQQWRAMARTKGIPFFAFTIVREPISFATSYYTYYHTQSIFGFQQFRPDRFDEENLLSHAMPSPQCMFLTRTEHAYRDEQICKKRPNYVCGEPLRLNFTQAECHDAYEALRDDLDWVGVTQKLSTETFPLLNAVVNRTVHFPILNSSGRKVHKSQLSPTAIYQLQNLTVGDAEIFQRTMTDFPVTMWENYESQSADATEYK